MKVLSRLFPIFILAMTLFACNTAPDGEAATTGEATDTADASATAIDYSVDASASAVTWVGSKPGGQHNGTISMKEGSLSVKDGNIEAGKFVLDMNTITVLDIPAGEGKEDLEGHLKGSKEDNADHFFNVAKYPTATFEIANVTPIENDSLMSHTITGNLTMKDTTLSVTFKANVNLGEAGLVAESNDFTIDRTKWGVNYGSKNVFADLGDKFINDEIGLKVNLVALAPAN